MARCVLCSIGMNDDDEGLMFDDEATIIEVRDEEVTPRHGEDRLATRVSDIPLLEACGAAEPPALPFPLFAKKDPLEEAWLGGLTPAARAVLEQARVIAPVWPLAGRVPGAVAVPIHAPSHA